MSTRRVGDRRESGGSACSYIPVRRNHLISDPSRVFDGLFYIELTRPATPLLED